MKRLCISFTIPQIKRLTDKARLLGISIAELVRRVIDEHMT